MNNLNNKDLEKISLEQFTAEIETTLSNYADTNDIDKQSIKTWVIQALRKFGKNICERNETVVEVKNSRALLPETFKSLTFAVKVKTKPFTDEEHKQLVSEKQYIQNEAIWDSLTNSYIVDYCTTYLTTEKSYSPLTTESPKFYGYELLSLSPYTNKDTLDVDCFNTHPYISSNCPNEITIKNRSLGANFKEGFIFLRYNSLPMDEQGEPAIPIISTGEIYDYIFNLCKSNIAEGLIANNKGASGLGQLYATWAGANRNLLHGAQCESKMGGLSKSWDRKYYRQNLLNRQMLNIPTMGNPNRRY
jgi:hypothetical protein